MVRNISLKRLAEGYRIYPVTKQHSKKRPLSTIKLYKEVLSKISSCANPRNPPHTVSIIATRKRESIIGFNTVFSENVATNIGKEFLFLLSKHFLSNNKYHKIFNKENVKLCYSCVPNMGDIIAQHIKQVLKRFSSADTETPPCNCHKKHDCPLEGKCCTKCVIYKSSVCTPNVKTISYYGCCVTDFKARYYNHKKSFKISFKRHQKELSKLVWQLKDEGHILVIKWSIVCKAKPYSSGAIYCQLCLAEKLAILRADSDTTLNKRSELLAKCRRSNKYKLIKILP